MGNPSPMGIACWTGLHWRIAARAVVCLWLETVEYISCVGAAWCAVLTAMSDFASRNLRLSCGQKEHGRASDNF